MTMNRESLEIYKLSSFHTLHNSIKDVDSALPGAFGPDLDLCSRSLYKTKISSIEQQHWGSVFYLWGPSGELLHITELGS